ncbi:MAG: hypothetical protein HS117_25840 [Verrucomicrobiaceae bacterium]|nr:hypothetical protein [Verrucomicrobiaceae bacterium]
MGDLVIFHKQLGDTVLLEPVLRKIALASGQPVQLLCPASLHSLLALMPHTSPVQGRHRWLPDRLWAFDWGGRTTRASAVTFCREKHLLIPNRDWVTRAHRAIFSEVHVKPYLDRYIARYMWDETPVPEPPGGFEPPVLEKPPADWTREGLCPEEPFLLFNPVSAWQRKCYEPAKWAPALRCAHELGLKRIVMTGGMEPWHYEHCAQIAKEAGVELTDVSGMTNLPEFMHLISRARMVLCVDGAASHLARGFGVPSVTLFGPSYTWMWHLADPRHLAVDASDFSAEPRPPTSVVPPEKVVEAVQAVWEAAQGPAEPPRPVLPENLRAGITGRMRAVP